MVLHRASASLKTKRETRKQKKRVPNLKQKIAYYTPTPSTRAAPIPTETENKGTLSDVPGLRESLLVAERSKSTDLLRA